MFSITISRRSERTQSLFGTENNASSVSIQVCFGLMILTKKEGAWLDIV